MNEASISPVIIVGAGSVGLMLANLLGSRGIPALVVERRASVEDSAKAIGISPVSLEICNRLGLASTLIAAGRMVRGVSFHGERRKLGQLDFQAIGSEFPFILSLPQGRTEAILAANLERFPQVRLLRQHEVKSLSRHGQFWRVSGHNQALDVPFDLDGHFVVACDGGKSLVRHLAGLDFSGGAYRDTFLMGDFDDRTGWGDVAHLFFTRHGSVESFPLPAGRRRYVLSTPRFTPEDGGAWLREQIRRRCSGLELGQDQLHWESAFGVQHFQARHWWRDGLVLCGDAAHLMSPIVGQNMNTGFADAEMLAECLGQALDTPSRTGYLLRNYQRVRQRAARSATGRAWFMMRLGTSRGWPWSPVRNVLVSLALGGTWKIILSRLFSMVSIPAANLQRSRNRTPAGLAGQ